MLGERAAAEIFAAIFDRDDDVGLVEDECAQIVARHIDHALAEVVRAVADRVTAGVHHD